MPGSGQTSIDSLIAELWQRNQPLILERLALLDSTVAASERCGLSSEQWKEAESTAHKLSGCLGMFGFPKGTELAREIEAECQSSAPDLLRLKRLATSLRTVLFP